MSKYSTQFVIDSKPPSFNTDCVLIFLESKTKNEILKELTWYRENYDKLSANYVDLKEENENLK